MRKTLLTMSSSSIGHILGWLIQQMQKLRALPFTSLCLSYDNHLAPSTLHMEIQVQGAGTWHITTNLSNEVFLKLM